MPPSATSVPTPVGRVEGGDAGAAGAQPLGQRALRGQLDLQLAGEVQPGQLLVAADERADRPADPAGVEQHPERLVVDPAVVGDRGEARAPCSSRASMSAIGTPQSPNPPTARVAPSGMSATASRCERRPCPSLSPSARREARAGRRPACSSVRVLPPTCSPRSELWSPSIPGRRRRAHARGPLGGRGAGRQLRSQTCQPTRTRPPQPHPREEQDPQPSKSAPITWPHQPSDPGRTLKTFEPLSEEAIEKIARPTTTFTTPPPPPPPPPMFCNPSPDPSSKIGRGTGRPYPRPPAAHRGGPAADRAG